MSEDGSDLVSLNRMLASVPLMNARVVSEFLTRRHLAGLQNANCPSSFCDCNNGYCACRGVVSTEFDPGALISQPALEQMRKERIEMLQKQLDALRGS